MWQAREIFGITQSQNADSKSALHVLGCTAAVKIIAYHGVRTFLDFSVTGFELFPRQSVVHQHSEAGL